jgi:hypothetical protein
MCWRRVDIGVVRDVFGVLFCGCAGEWLLRAGAELVPVFLSVGLGGIEGAGQAKSK